jgi:hypothetical protein
MNKKQIKGIEYTKPSEELLNNPETVILYNMLLQGYNSQLKSNYDIPSTNVINNVSNNLINNQSLSNNSNYSSTNNQPSSSIINVVSTIRALDTNKNIVYKYKNKELLKNIDINNNVDFPLFIKKKDFILVPSKAISAVKYISETKLKAIHQDLDVAKELCLIFISLLTSTYFEILEGSDGWKPLHSSHLRDLFKGVADYKKVREALEYPLRNNVLIECDHHYIINEKCFFYKIGNSYVKKGIVSYQLKTEIAKQVYSNYQLIQLVLSNQNIICKNLFEFYKNIELPTIEMANQEAKRLVKKKFRTKKGKLLRFRNKHIDSYFRDAENLAFVEDHIKLFGYLTENGLIRPQVTEANNGCRVVDSFTLMPSWIRKMVKFKGSQLVEVDYSCLHPNIAMSLYGGKMEYITHQQISEESGLDIVEVKLEHLSFFNKEFWQMKESQLWNYYKEKEPEMINRIVGEKLADKNNKHKITSMRLLKKEVEIMTSVIEKLNSEGIYVGYVYDALLSSPEYAGRVKEVMDSIILEQGVKSLAKIGINQEETKSEVISETQKTVEKSSIQSSDKIDKKNKKNITQSKENSQNKVPITDGTLRDNLKVIESQKKPIVVIDSDEIFFNTLFKEKYINDKLELEFTDVKVVIDETKYFFDKVTPITDIEYGYDSKKYYSYSFLNDIDAKVYSQSIAC